MGRGYRTLGSMIAVYVLVGIFSLSLLCFVAAAVWETYRRLRINRAVRKLMNSVDEEYRKLTSG